MKTKISSAQQLLDHLNKEQFRVTKQYEELFWTSYMGDHTVDKKKDEAMKERDAFQSNSELHGKVVAAMDSATKEEKEKLSYWKKFFEAYQTPEHLLKLKDKIALLETKITKKLTTRKEGYVDPYTKKFVNASKLKMGMMISTHNDEAIRKACFEAKEKLAYDNLDDYLKFVSMLNEYARGLGYEDFYAYKIHTEEGMTKKELFQIFDEIHTKTKFAFGNIRALEKKMPGLRKPWNFSYMMSGDFTKEEDQYFPFDEALTRWGTSFAALGVDFRDSKINLDLLDRQGKYNNGFCHWPEIIRYENGKRIPGKSNFTCNVVYGQIGSASDGYVTLFHEGGHAAHYLNSDQTETCLNHEYPPASTAWAETQSMSMDTIFSSIEWKSRYAKNKDGEGYPFDLFKREVERLHVLRPLSLVGIIFIADFERNIYEEKNLTKEKVLAAAKKMYRKYFDKSIDSLTALNTPHIYSWSNVCSYHAYGLADLAVFQWRDYFYKKYGYIVDNPNVGKEMTKVWKLAAAKTFKEFVVMATGKPLSAKPWLAVMTKSLPTVLKDAQARIDRLKSVPKYNKKIDLNAHVTMLSGKKKITDSKQGFEKMAAKYATWLKTQKTK